MVIPLLVPSITIFISAVSIPFLAVAIYNIPLFIPIPITTLLVLFTVAVAISVSLTLTVAAAAATRAAGAVSAWWR